MKINVEQFKTLHEQIDILNRWGNNFLVKNPKEKEKVLEYLQDNNFQTGVMLLLHYYGKILMMELRERIINLLTILNSKI